MYLQKRNLIVESSGSSLSVLREWWLQRNMVITLSEPIFLH